MKRVRDNLREVGVVQLSEALAIQQQQVGLLLLTVEHDNYNYSIVFRFVF